MSSVKSALPVEEESSKNAIGQCMPVRVRHPSKKILKFTIITKYQTMSLQTGKCPQLAVM